MIHIATGTWKAPLGRDAVRPDPLGGLSFAKFDPHRALLFGGRCARGRMNEVFILDLDLRVSCICCIFLEGCKGGWVKLV